ncbi:glutaminyl-tRNA synthase (glutamine-hydrolyzing) subunit A [Candidatus Woesebacteria bacterium RIFOXYB1_FULL_38_16]|uniref:Glutamyl-tRNA(Gln) amidotransferase subunit A n=1 Tax=Candidatus Woesebacteria bacterium RIFOXYB1_FULL_38_16 TaxID=1802538 RepID=A0A1F8CTC4_9BACT|nr:MAG: glutaminyl-tRNA synthase (glutamine-hydrolyzing) subunit A [Candidatus Woesebacteria bacterium RIFOXYA1_FULL_38_9]OGM79560.1 MAG: glutaminyl-tRNA synthase (glutamine-hydrolyzing) subunit A [Candidatus Woesebacteria bacterium RIFOXYB1_FULL_38_16]
MIESVPDTIEKLQEGLLKKNYSCVELVDYYLNRIKKYDSSLNSFLTISEDSAYSQAKKMDKVLNGGSFSLSEYPLLGVVVSFKDLFLTKGIRTTAGSKVLQSYVPPYSSTVVMKLLSAGAIMIGKTNCDAWAHGASGENSDYGPTKNPWNKKYVPGGSSSGAAVSVSSDFSFVALGTDTGGSVRQPASFTNLVGLKPTYGLVSRYGVVAMASSLDTIGHFTKTVEDSRRILAVTGGIDNYDSTLCGEKGEKIGEKIKIGIPKEYFGEGLDLEVREIILKAIEILKKKGIAFKEVSLPHTEYAVPVYYVIQPAEVSSNLSRYDGVRYGNDRDSFGSEARRRIMLGTYVLSEGYRDAYYLKAMKVRKKISDDFDHVFVDVDAILCPTAPTPAFKLGEKANDPLKMYLADIYTASASLAGIPGLSIPAGFTKDKRPVGMQLLGKRFNENKLFDIGEMFQKLTNYHLEKPVI